MSYIIKNTSALINSRLTDTGRQRLSEGNFNISYFQIGDSEVSYDVLPSSYNQYNTMILEPAFNAQNSSGVPQSNKQNVKYPYYVDGFTGNTYGIPYMDSVVSPVYNRAEPRGFFTGITVDNFTSWSAYTDNSHTINSNYIVDMTTLNGSNIIEIIYSGCNLNIGRLLQYIMMVWLNKIVGVALKLPQQPQPPLYHQPQRQRQQYLVKQLLLQQQCSQHRPL